MGVRLYEQIGSDGLSALLRETIRSEVLVDLRVSSSEPILSAVDPILYSTTVHGDSVQTTANPCTGTAMHRQDTPHGGSRRVRQSHHGAESRSFCLQTVPSWANVIPQHNAVPQSDSEAGRCTGTFQSYSP